MAKYKPSNENQMIMLPISLQDQLVPGTLEHTINRLVDKNVNLSVFDERASPLLYTAYMSAIRSILPLRPSFFDEIGWLSRILRWCT